MQKTVNPVWSILDVCHIRLIRVRQYGRKKKNFFAMHFGENLRKHKILRNSKKEAVFKISSHSVHRGARRY